MGLYDILVKHSLNNNIDYTTKDKRKNNKCKNVVCRIKKIKNGRMKMICKKCNHELAYCPERCLIRASYIGVNKKIKKVEE